MTIYNRLTNQSVTITASDSTLTSHTWKVNNETESETSSILTKRFLTPGTYVIKHEGSNTCGSCTTPVEHTINVTESTTGVPPIVMIGIGVGALMMLLKKKK